MTRRTIAALITQADDTLPDNTVEAITPADVRDMVKNVIDTYAPGYGAASRTTLTLVALGIAPQIVTYDAQLAATPEYVVNLAAGTITRLAQGLPSTVNRVSFYADVICPTGNEVVLSLYRDGIDIPGGTTVSGQGGSNPVQAAFSVGVSSEDGLDHVYTIRASKISGGADNVTLSEVRFIMEYVPTLGI